MSEEATDRGPLDRIVSQRDRELLELAAKAAGVHTHHWYEPHGVLMCSSVEGGDPDYGWNPLANDGDAFRLVVSLRLDVLFGAADVEVTASQRATDDDGVCPWSWFATEPGDANAATRRAIVQAAAQVATMANAALSRSGNADFQTIQSVGPESA